MHPSLFHAFDHIASLAYRTELVLLARPGRPVA